jgi:hypothetical protein
VTVDDTHPRTQAVMTRLLAAMSPAERFAMAVEMTDFVCEQSLAAIAVSMPAATPLEVQLLWSEVHYGKALTDRVRRHLAARSA